MFPKACVVKIDMGLFFHYGIFDGNGKVIHNSKRHGRVVIESLKSFSEGKEVLADLGIFSGDADAAIERAKRYIGTPYNLLQENCEHFVRMAHGLLKESPQLQKYMITATGIGVVCISTKNKPVQFAAGAAALTALTCNCSENLATKVLASAAIGAAIGLACEM